MPLKNITKEDIKRVYEDLEDGRLLNSYGKPFEDRASYYSKVFKGKLFRMIKKNDIAEDVLEFSKPEKNKGKVRFFIKEDYDKMSMVTIKLSHKVLLQLCWDIGENIMTILQLQKKDCQRRINEETKEAEYLINLPREKIKRSRTSRTELTNYPETVELLDLLFRQGKRVFISNPKGKDFRVHHNPDGTRTNIYGCWEISPFNDDDYLFDYGHKQAEHVFRRVTRITGVKCKPNGERPTLKDLRSSMACHLLKQGWSIEEVKGRMGHKPSSKAIDRYVTFLALDRHKPKQRMNENQLNICQAELAAARNRERIHREWKNKHQDEIRELKALLQIYLNKFQVIEQYLGKEIPEYKMTPGILVNPDEMLSGN